MASAHTYFNQNSSGLWAYHLYESRQNRPEGHTLPELLKRKWDQRMGAKVESSKILAESEAQDFAELEKALKQK